MSQKECENFHRHSILIVDHTRDGLADLIEVDVVNKYSSLNSFEHFINKHQHEIYHLCYNKGRCCQCPPGYVLPQNRILHPTQLDLLFDKHGGKLPCHKPARQGDFCCCTAKSGLSLTVLDVTLARCILINFCSDVFWDSCLTKMGVTLEGFLNRNKHDIYHISTGNKPCCQCSPGYKYPVHQKSINQNDWKLLFGISHSPCTMHPSVSTGVLNMCSVSATTGISVNHLTPNLAGIILENFCSLRQAVDILIQSRNNIYGHAKEAKISDSDFAAFWSTAENALLEMSKTTSKEPETKQKLVDLKNRCLDEILLEQYKVKILEQIQMENDIHEYMEEVKEKLKDVVQKKTEEIKESILEKIEESNDKILQRMEHVPKKYIEEQEIKRGRIKEYTEARIQYHVDEKTYVSTNADKIAMERVQNTGIVVIVGPPGAGKSRLGLHLMRQYSELHKNYSCFQIDNIMEWKDIVNIDDNCIILCDDIFGKTNCNYNEDVHSKIIDEIHTYVKHGRVKLIVTMRDNIKRMCTHLFSRHVLFMDTQFLDIGAEYEMSVDEKRNCLINHLRKHLIEVTEDLSKTNVSPKTQSEAGYVHTKTVDKITSLKPNNILGFPESCFLFASNRKFLRFGAIFFERANEILCQTISSLRKRGEKDRQCMLDYTILVYVLVNGDKIDLNNLNIKNLQELCLTIYPVLQNNLTTYEVEDATSRLCGQMLQDIKPGRYSFQHRATFEAVLLSYRHFDQSKMIQLMDYKFILEFARPEGYKGTEGEVFVDIHKNNYQDLANKLFSRRLENKSLLYDYIKEIVSSKICRFAGVDIIKEMGGIYHLLEFKRSSLLPCFWLNIDNSACSLPYFDLSLAILLYTDDNDVVQYLFNIIGTKLSSVKSLFLKDLLSAVFIFLCHTKSDYKARIVWKLIKSHQIYISNTAVIGGGWDLVVQDLSIYKFMLSIVADHKCLDLEKIMNKACEVGDEGIVKELLETFDHSLFDVKKAMNNACRSDKVESVKLLLDTIDHSLFDVEKAMNNACILGDRKVELVKLLLEKFDNNLIDVKKALYNACRWSPGELVKLLLETFDHSLFDVKEAINNACRLGRVELIQLLLETFDHSLFDVEEAMNYACILGNRKVELVKLFLDTINHNLFDIKKAMNSACLSDEVELVKLLLETFDNSLFDVKKAMNNACRRRKVELVKLLLETFDHRLFDVKEAMNNACRLGEVELIKLLLETFDHNLFDINVIKDTMNNACLNGLGRVELVKLLLDTIDHSLFDVKNAMNYACLRDYVELVKLLLDTIDHRLFDVKEAMNSACIIGRVELVKLLLETFDNSLFDVKEAMNNACIFGRVESVKLLLETFDNSLFDVKEAMNNACHNCEVEFVNLLLETFDNSLLDVKEAMNNACLGRLESVKLLLETFDNSLFDVKEAMKNACCKCEVEFVKLLLETFDNSLFDIKVAMNNACLFGRVESVKLLLETFDRSLFDVKEAMNNACILGRVELVKLLLETFDHSLFDVKKAMINACILGKVESVKLLLETFDNSMFDVKEAMKKAMENACRSRNGEVELVQLLLEKFYYTVFNVQEEMSDACKSGNVELVKFMIRSFDNSLFDIKETMNNACLSGKVELVKLLLETFDHSLFDVKEAMNVACKSGNVKLVKFMISMFDNKLFNVSAALNIACEWHRVQVANILLETFDQNSLNVRIALRTAKRVGDKELVTILQAAITSESGYKKGSCIIS